MRIGYVRCSTVEQNEARQIKAMHDNNIERLFIDKASGKDMERQSLKEMMSFARNQDIVIVESISRIARNTRDLLNIVSELSDKGVDFISLKENIDTTTPQGRFVLTIFGALAELEREQTRERAAEGIAIAKAEGKYQGRQPIPINEAELKKVCAQWREGKITATEAMKKLSLKPNTFYRRVKEYNL
ncbi:MAG: recombinase family protein [Syntrophomonadaceae bacterium]